MLQTVDVGRSSLAAYRGPAPHAIVDDLDRLATGIPVVGVPPEGRRPDAIAALIPADRPAENGVRAAVEAVQTALSSRSHLRPWPARRAADGTAAAPSLCDTEPQEART